MYFTYIYYIYRNAYRPVTLQLRFPFLRFVSGQARLAMIEGKTKKSQERASKMVRHKNNSDENRQRNFTQSCEVA